MKTRKAVTGPLAGALATLAVVGLAIAAGQTESYTVKKGDTLWEIAAGKLGEGKRWPEVWERNAQIKDPNLIYPGNQVLLPGAAQPVAPPVMGMAEPAPAPAPVDEVTYTRARDAGFVSADEYENAGRVTGAGTPGESLYTNLDGMDVFVNRGARDGVRPGDNFRVFRSEGQVLHPVTEQPVGYRIAEKGQMRVIQVDDRVSRCKITRSFDVILRGDLVTPFKPLPEEFLVKPAPQDLKGTILAGQNGRIEFGREDLVYLDRGARQGLEVGSRLAVYHGANGSAGYPGDPALPPDVLGEAIVIRTSERGSTALLTRSKAPIHMGDHVASLQTLGLPGEDARDLSSDPAYQPAPSGDSNEATFTIRGSGLRSAE